MLEKLDTVEQMKFLVEPYEYQIQINPIVELYIVPNNNDMVQIKFADGLFMLEVRDFPFVVNEVDPLIHEIKKYEVIAKQLNEMMEETEEKRDAILAWQSKVEKTGMDSNLNEVRKFWTLIESYGLQSSRNGNLNFNEIWIWNNEFFTIRMYIDKDNAKLGFDGVLYAENGDLIKRVSNQTIIKELNICYVSDFAVVFQLETGLGLRIQVNNKEPRFFQYSFVEIGENNIL